MLVTLSTLARLATWPAWQRHCNGGDPSGLLTDGCACVWRQAALRSSLQTEKAEHTELRQQVEQMREERGGWQDRLKTSEERLRALAAAELKAAAAEAAEQKERATAARLKEARAELKELRKQVSELEAELAAVADASRDEASAAAERDECKAREGKARPAPQSRSHAAPRAIPHAAAPRRIPTTAACASCPAQQPRAVSPSALYPLTPTPLLLPTLTPQLQAKLRAAELERDAYRKQLQEALASADEPSAAARAEREAAALRQQLIELQADN